MGDERHRARRACMDLSLASVAATATDSRSGVEALRGPHWQKSKPLPYFAAAYGVSHVIELEAPVVI